MKRIIGKFRDTESTSDLGYKNPPSINPPTENIETVRKGDDKNSEAPIPHSGQKLELATAYSHERFASSSSIDSRTKVCLIIEYLTTTRECCFFEQNHF